MARFDYQYVVIGSGAAGSAAALMAAGLGRIRRLLRPIVGEEPL